MQQPTLLDALDEGLCQYGTPPPGETNRPCNRPATHGARWRQGERTGGVDCCRDHADYYASAWAPIHLRCGWRDPGPHHDTAWMEILPTAQERP